MADSSTPVHPKEDSLSVLKAIAEASAVFVALTFLGGWSYLASYYKTFGLDPLDMDVAVPIVSTVGVVTLHHMIQDSAIKLFSYFPAFWLMAAGVLLASLAFLFHRFVRTHRGQVVAGVTVLLFLVISLGVSRGRRAANEDMFKQSDSLPNVTLFTQKIPAVLDHTLPRCVAFTSDYGVEPPPCRLLLHSGKIYYFFQPIAASTPADVPNIDVYALPESQIDAIHVQRGRER
ncbi:MAG: hypothetical protein JO307_13095 [Bryobacterales bacterium]|nr:hypothetical protein [Bryobacterales bacterium]MBV9399173.1 hypothetical protein [Bryobacterales bacterium]